MTLITTMIKITSENNISVINDNDDDKKKGNRVDNDDSNSTNHNFKGK